jgi:hypothetical protein
MVAHKFKQKVLNFCENSYIVKSIKILVCYIAGDGQLLGRPRQVRVTPGGRVAALFGQIRDATVDARQYQPRCVQLGRESRALCYRIHQLEQSLDRSTTVLLQSERERVDTREELLHVKEDIRRPRGSICTTHA